MTKAGFSRDFVRRAILPDWWDKDCDGDHGLLAEVELRVARFLGVSLEAVREFKTLVEIPGAKGARLRKVTDMDRDRLAPAIHAAVRIAEAAVRHLRDSSGPPSLPPRDGKEWAGLLTERFGRVDLSAIVQDLWARGIPVILAPDLPKPRFQGLACVVAGRPAIVLGHDIDIPARLAFFVTHEVGHIANRDCTPEAPVVDEDEAVQDQSIEEKRADEFAWTTLLRGNFIPLGAGADSKAVAEKAQKIESNHKIDAGALVWQWANRTHSFGDGQMALRALYLAQGGKRLLREHFEKNVDLGSAGETDLALLSLARGGEVVASSSAG